MLRMRVERGERVVEPADAVVVEQQAHAHAALAARQSASNSSQPVVVAVPDVVLDVERSVGRAGKQAARGEGVARLSQGVDAGLARMGGDVRHDGARQARALGIGERGGLRPTVERRQTAAARK